ENAGYDSASYRTAMEQTVQKQGEPRLQIGDITAAFANGAKAYEAIYYTPHFVHTPMEPPAALADVKVDSGEVWASCQDAQALRSTVAAAIGMDESKVTARVTLLGGAFGR